MTVSYPDLVAELRSAAQTLRIPTGSPWPNQDKITAELIERAGDAVKALHGATLSGRGTANAVVPAWPSAPAWARWRAMDSSGDWYWFERRPYPESIHGAPGDGPNVWDVEEGHMQRAASTEAQVPGWEGTLQERPEAANG